MPFFRIVSSALRHRRKSHVPACRDLFHFEGCDPMALNMTHVGSVPVEAVKHLDHD